MKSVALLLLAGALLAGCELGYQQRARSPLMAMRTSVTTKSHGDFDVPPKVLEGYRPDYPETEGERRESGYVVLVCTIGVDGRAQDFEVESMSSPAFVIEAMRAIAKWKWSPALKNGKPVPQKVRVPMTFRA